MLLLFFNCKLHVYENNRTINLHNETKDFNFILSRIFLLTQKFVFIDRTLIHHQCSSHTARLPMYRMVIQLGYAEIVSFFVFLCACVCVSYH